MKEQLQRLKEFLFQRRYAYIHVFNPNDAYVRKVLKDLHRFCRAHDSTFHQDPRLHAVLEGRREVLLRILRHTKLDNDQFWHAYGRPDLEENEHFLGG